MNKVQKRRARKKKQMNKLTRMVNKWKGDIFVWVLGLLKKGDLSFKKNISYLWQYLLLLLFDFTKHWVGSVATYEKI